jgi:hypothetical protein
MGRTAQAPRRKRISPVTRHIRALPCRGGSGVLFTRRNLHMPATTRREELKRLLALAAIAPLQAGPATRPSAGQVVPASGIGRRIRHLSYSDQGGRPDRGHLRDDGWIDVCERLECWIECAAGGVEAGLKTRLYIRGSSTSRTNDLKSRSPCRPARSRRTVRAGGSSRRPRSARTAAGSRTTSLRQRSRAGQRCSPTQSRP